MLERLTYVKLDPAWMLDAGCGPAPQAVGLQARFPRAKLCALDRSHAMLQQIAQPQWFAPWRRTPRVSRVCADLAALPLAQASMGLVWSNMAVHLVDAAAALREFARVLQPEGLLMFSCFGPDTLREIDQPPQYLDMHDLGDLLTQCGFSAPVMDMEVFHLNYSDREQLAREQWLAGRLPAPPRLASMSTDARPALAFEIIYGHAWKGVSRRHAGEPAVVNIDSIRRRR